MLSAVTFPILRDVKIVTTLYIISELFGIIVLLGRLNFDARNKILEKIIPLALVNLVAVFCLGHEDYLSMITTVLVISLSTFSAKMLLSDTNVDTEAEVFDLPILNDNTVG